MNLRIEKFAELGEVTKDGTNQTSNFYIPTSERQTCGCHRSVKTGWRHGENLTAVQLQESCVSLSTFWSVYLFEMRNINMKSLS